MDNIPLFAKLPLDRPCQLKDARLWHEIESTPEVIRDRVAVLLGKYTIVDGGQVLSHLWTDPMASCVANSREWKWEAAGKWMALILRSAEIANEYAPVEIGELLHRGVFFDAPEAK